MELTVSSAGQFIENFQKAVAYACAYNLIFGVMLHLVLMFTLQSQKFEMEQERDELKRELEKLKQVHAKVCNSI